MKSRLDGLALYGNEFGDRGYGKLLRSVTPFRAISVEAKSRTMCRSVFTRTFNTGCPERATESSHWNATRRVGARSHLSSRTLSLQMLLSERVSLLSSLMLVSWYPSLVGVNARAHSTTQSAKGSRGVMAEGFPPSRE